MLYSLYECRDGTFVVVPKGFTPPIEVYKRHGDCRHVSDDCRGVFDSPVWDEVSRVIDRRLYAPVRAEVALRIFDVEHRRPPAPASDRRWRRPRQVPARAQQSLRGT